MWQTFGHEGVKNILENQLEAKAFSHAYLFTGPEGIGKKKLAMEFAQKVLQSGNLQNHPDFTLLEAAGEITMDRVLEFISHLNLKPFVGNKKIAVINNAQNLNQQSANALLKTLEEPSPSSLIFLISTQRRLLPTIVSRCQLFNFNAFTQKQLEAFVKLEGLALPSDSILFSFGSIARLMQFSGDFDTLRETKENIGDYKKIRENQTAEKLLSVARYSRLEEAQLFKLLENWCQWQTLELAREPENFGKVEAIFRAINDLKNNKNTKLILQGLFLKI